MEVNEGLGEGSPQELGWNGLDSWPAMGLAVCLLFFAILFNTIRTSWAHPTRTDSKYKNQPN